MAVTLVVDLTWAHGKQPCGALALVARWGVENPPAASRVSVQNLAVGLASKMRGPRIKRAYNLLGLGGRG